MHAVAEISAQEQADLAQGLSAVLEHLVEKDRVPARSFILQTERGHRWTPKQAFFAKDLLARGQRAQERTKPQGKVGDLWGDVTAEAVETPQEATEPKVVQVDGQDLATCVAQVIQPAIAQVRSALEAQLNARQDAFNEAAARKIADEAVGRALEKLEKRVPRELRITAARHDGSSGLVSGHKHERLADALTCVANNIPVMLVGPAGSGKSTAGEQIAAAIGAKFFMQGAASGSHEYLGYKDAAGQYHTTPWREAFEHGGLFMAEELDSGSADVPLVLNAALANGHMAFPDSPHPIKRHKDFRIIANANTYGLGADRVYVGRTQLDGATIDRFAFIDWNYDERLEAQIATNAAWVKRVQAVRRAVQAEKARLIISPRASINGSILLATGLPEQVVCDMVLWKGVDKDLRAKIEARLGAVR